MGTRMFSLVASLVLISACSGEIGDAPGAARRGPTSDFSNAANAAVPNGPTGAQDPFPQDDPTCPSAAAVVSVSNGWQSTEASQPAFDTLQLSFLARPEAANIDALVGVGAQDIDDFPDAMLTVRFADDGFIDVQDGSAYDSDVAFAYEPDVWYSITISADIATGTYDVEVARCGESPQVLITGAAFRSEAGASDRLTTWALWSSQSAKLDVSTPSWVASGNCAPATCQSLGLASNQYGNRRRSRTAESGPRVTGSR